MIHNYKDTCEELKPCPFCGGTPIWYLKGNDYTKKRTIVVKCPDCGTTQELGLVHLTTEWGCEKAIENWNRRI